MFLRIENRSREKVFIQKYRFFLTMLHLKKQKITRFLQNADITTAILVLREMNYVVL